MAIDAYSVDMFISVVPNRNSNATILLREIYREDGHVKNRTLAELVSLRADFEAFRRQLE